MVDFKKKPRQGKVAIHTVPSLHPRKASAAERRSIAKRRRNQAPPETSDDDTGLSPAQTTASPVPVKRSPTPVGPGASVAAQEDPWDIPERIDADPVGAPVNTGQATAAPSPEGTSEKTRDTAGKAALSPPVPIADLPDLAGVLPELCVRYREIAEQEASIKTEKQELSAQIEPLMEAFEVRAVLGDTWLAVRSRGVNVSISAELLLKAGVTMDTIEQCTVRKPYTYVQVLRPGKAKTAVPVIGKGR